MSKGDSYLSRVYVTDSYGVYTPNSAHGLPVRGITIRENFIAAHVISHLSALARYYATYGSVKPRLTATI